MTEAMNFFSMERNVRLEVFRLKIILLEREKCYYKEENMNRNLTMEVQRILNCQASGLKQSKEYTF